MPKTPLPASSPTISADASIALAQGTDRPEDVQATFCATLVDEWVRAGITHAVVSPGSRSTPMALALAAETRLHLDVVLDERSASFRALGIARVTGRPAVLLCTSGTAAVEYHPAVVEADLDRVPLIVCTADRPPELHGIGAPQTVDQQFLFGRSVRWFGQLGVPDRANRSAWRSFGSRAVLEATTSPKGCGPVQLNLAFREPLVGVAGELPPGRENDGPWHASLVGNVLSAGDVHSVASMVSGKRGVILAGAHSLSSSEQFEPAERVEPADSSEVAVIHALAARLGWPILADPRSGLRVPGGATVSGADLILRHQRFAEAMRPEVIVRLGAPWASKVMSQWLASCGEAEDVVVDPDGAWLDPNRSAAFVVRTSAEDLCQQLLDFAQLQAAPSSWTAQWATVAAASEAVLAEQLDHLGQDAAPTEPWVARQLVRTLSNGSELMVSSSMPIRDVEWFSGSRRGLRVHANRGANGIDGVVSTVLGIASAASGTTVGLLGDLSFLHDAGALGSARGVNATFVVIDNSGGGIFQFLPQATSLDHERFEQLFGTPQHVDIEAVASAYGVAVTEVRTVSAFNDVMATIDRPEQRGLHLVLVRTNREDNVAEHARLVGLVGAAVDKSFR